MSAVAFLEVVENDDGEIVLRRTDSSPGASEPLVAIRFSAEARALLGDHLGEIASAMIGAGVQMSSRVLQGSSVLADDEPQLLH